jgi:hypothetical protein
LRETLRAGKIGDRDAIEAAAQILDALAHAHRLGIVHRDVKPSNVLVEETASISIRLLDFGLAQFDEADTLTAVGDVPGTLAYIAPERLRGGDATEASDVWAVGVVLWEALVGEHPFWGVPLPQVAAAIEAGAKPLGTARPDLPPEVIAAVSSALTIEPSRRPSAERLAAALRTALTTPRRDRSKSARPRQVATVRKAALASLPLERRLASSALAAVTVTFAAALMPFWPPGLVLLLALAAAAATIRMPRLGLAIALFVPVFPLGNIAQAAAVAYGAIALAWLAAFWRDARAGLLFVAGPLLAAIGAIALLPLAVQPARGRLRRALQAFAGVLVAAAVAGLRGKPLPLTGSLVPNLGVDGSTRVTDVIQALAVVVSDNAGIVTVALVLGLAAALLPDARRRGLKGIAVLGIGQIALIVVFAPALPALSIVLGTCALCGILAALTLKSGRYP